ncbi:MAG: hypothetical protein N2235_17680 [Fischerella sp.]|nr:hypothetical protein [Fischerella sp.]
MRLKRWESPRRQGRNDKGKGGSARKRQIKKQQQMLRQKLRTRNGEYQQIKEGTGEVELNFPRFFWAFL